VFSPAVETLTRYAGHVPLWLYMATIAVLTLVISPAVAVLLFAVATRVWKAPVPLRRSNALPFIALIYAEILVALAEITTRSVVAGSLGLGLLAASFFVTRHITRAKWGRSVVITLTYFVFHLVITLPLGFGLRATIAEAFKVPSAGMAPTISPGDRIICDHTLPPRRWDLVVYRQPWEPRVVVVGRLVAMPGETIEIVPPGLRINGQPIALGPGMGSVAYTARSVPGMPTRTHLMCNAYGGPVTLGPDEYFILGDNSSQSLDSRYWEATETRQAGALARDRIVGVVRLIYSPFDRVRVFR
jgi:signal peptidase I